MNLLAKQRRSRERLDDSVRRYVNLRAGDGSYTSTVRTTDREGRPVVALLTLNILPEETS